jgi:UDP-N-acetylglucosamine--N-acetylmuramyl-(pentapeptide) pyrophosphoryl-undecaprenol N-acetylglucosamine transferase
MPGHVLACASAGGHFKQLLRLVARLPDVEAVTWLTYDSGLIDDLLASSGRSGDRIVLAPYAAPRDLLNLARDALVTRRVLQEDDFDLAISTGAGLAVATLPVARVTGVRSVFIESATRAEGPSMSGRILERVPGVELYTQNPGYGPRWGHVGSVHDEFVAGEPRSSPGIDRVVVTLGTIQPYGFRRLILRLLEMLPAEAEVLWQTGATDVTGLPIDGRTTVPAPELERAIAEADVVIAHAGTGTAMTAFELGRCPVLVPRRHTFDEHVDDHQVETARMLAGRGLAVYAEVAELDLGHLLEASRRTVARLDRPPVLTL